MSNTTKSETNDTTGEPWDNLTWENTTPLYTGGMGAIHAVYTLRGETVTVHLEGVMNEFPRYSIHLRVSVTGGETYRVNDESPAWRHQLKDIQGANAYFPARYWPGLVWPRFNAMRDEDPRSVFLTKLGFATATPREIHAWWREALMKTERAQHEAITSLMPDSEKYRVYSYGALIAQLAQIERLLGEEEATR